ncbi:MAG: TlpA disulfide reductase family protein [Woeseiaceae bacterium]
MQRGTLIALILATCLATGPAYAESVDAGMTAPAWELESGDGTEFSFPTDAKGEASILFFWATWCPYCHALMPYLQKIQDDYSECGVTVYAIDFKDDGDPVEYMEKLGWKFTVFPLGDLVADDYGVFSAPGILVVNRDGVVTYRRKPTRAPPGTAIAEVWDAEIRAALDRAVGRTAAGL